MHKTTSKNSQGRADRILPKHMAGIDDMSVEDKIEMLRDKLRRIDKNICALPKNCPERKILGRNKVTLAYELRTLRGGKKNRQGIHIVFYEVAKRMIPPEQFNLIMIEAQHIYDCRAKSGEAELATQRKMELERNEF